MKYMLLLLLAGCSSVPALPSMPVVPGVPESVVGLHIPGGRCSAVVISPSLYVTAGHCAGDPATLSIGSRMLSSDPPVSALSPDIAVGHSSEDLPTPARIAPDVPKPGEAVLIAGFGCLRAGGARAGFWLSPGPDPDGDWMVAAPVCPGDSGAGVFNAQGELVAIVSKAGAAWAEGVAFVVPIGEAAVLF